MRKFLLPETGSFYKANLHCHSVISDGRLTPEQIKEAYMKEGYSVVAYTDHDVLVTHHDLTDDRFLALSGYEMEVDQAEPDKYGLRKCCHMCFVALEKDNSRMVCYNRERYVWGNAKNYRPQLDFDDTLPDYVRNFTHEGVSDMMRRGREGGFFVTYNHPTWSKEDYSDYIGYENMHAMEIYNHSCYSAGFPEYNDRVYDDMLRGGKKIFCIAADDNHDVAPIGSPHNDSFGGWIMIKADRLEYRTITRALEAGHFYASEGPEITALWFEDGKIHVECRDARKVSFIYAVRRAASVFGDENGPVTYACAEVPRSCGYVRVSVVDGEGRHADTNAYFAEDLYGEEN